MLGLPQESLASAQRRDRNVINKEDRDEGATGISARTGRLACSGGPGSFRLPTAEDGGCEAREDRRGGNRSRGVGKGVSRQLRLVEEDRGTDARREKQIQKRVQPGQDHLRQAVGISLHGSPVQRLGVRGRIQRTAGPRLHDEGSDQYRSLESE